MDHKGTNEYYRESINDEVKRKLLMTKLVVLLTFLLFTPLVFGQSTNSTNTNNIQITGNVVISGTATNSAALVQRRSSYPNGRTPSSLVLAYNSGNTAGNLLIALASFNTPPDTPGGNHPTISDSRGNTWIKLPLQEFNTPDDNTTIFVAYAENCRAGANTVTIGDGQGLGDANIAIYEYSGVRTSGSLDVTSTTRASSTTATPTSNSFTTNARDLLFVILADEHTAQSGYTAGTNFNLREFHGDHTDAEEDRLDVAAGTQTASINLSTSSNEWIMYVLAFKLQ